MPVISGPEDLAAFRQQWDGKRMLELLVQHNRRLRIDWTVGVGKSSNIDQTIEEAIVSERYDLVIALFPTRRIIEERQWVLNPPKGIRLVNLRPRPGHECGADMNRSWQVFEKNGLGALGRIELCGHCLLRPECAWPRQFGKSLKGSQVIFGAQAHLERSPYFLDQLAQWSEAERVLVVLDEANFIMKPFQRRIDRGQLQNFVDVLDKFNPRRWSKLHARWRYLCGLLLVAKTSDLRSHDWRFPQVYHDWSLAVQTLGYGMYVNAFSFLAFDLVHFGRSPLESRESASKGDILFAAVPTVSMDFIIYSGTAHQSFTTYRLGNEFASPFEDYSFINPETTWFNIASRLGARKYFKKNSDQILDFFAALVARRLREGKRPLLLAKKCFCAFCARKMEDKLRRLGVEAQVVINGWQADLLTNPKVVPLIHYGMIGTNLFQEFDCAYCLTGYYVNEEAINGILQDLLGSDMKIPLQISIEGRPCRRRAGVLNREDRIYDLHTLAQHALDHQEMDTVLQAVGRVRPYTKSREVITFQCADHPDISYTREFTCIGEARKYFDIAGKRSAQTVEMDWVITNARIEWAGVRVYAKGRDETIARINVHLEKLKKHLAAEYGIQNTQSHKQLTKFFQGCGLLYKFLQDGKVSFDKKVLKKNAGLHPAIALLRAARRASDLLSDKILSPDFVGEDGRVRAEHRQLGTDTGRQTTRWPNFLGLDRVLRPLVIPEEGNGIGEVDWSQVEAGVAAAVYGDDELVRMFNSGDVYSSMAQHFFRNQLPESDLTISGKEFKVEHKVLRNQMKSCTLGIIYGITPVGLAQTLGTTKAKAAALQKRFIAMFPRLQAALALASQRGAIRGYAYTISGLKRYRGKNGEASRWEKNWLTNHPVQGSAAVVFKAAGNRLDKLYRRYDARIIIPLHDAFIFEAPLDAMETVAEHTSRVMCDTLEEYFSVLRPQVEVNISRQDCWNKDGDGDELERWIKSLNELMNGQQTSNKEA